MAELITEQDRLVELAESVASANRYAIDTEFHRERTYYPQVALVQLAWDDNVVLIDPLEVDLTAMASVLDGPGVCILHAGVQDLEVLDLACGTIPSTIYDTQIAAGFLGVSTGSLVSVLDKYLGITIPKGDRLTDWMRRPLTKDQLRYAASDVDHLMELTDIINAELDTLGRRAWAEEESALLRERPRNRRPPEDAVLRIKEARSLKGAALRVATAVAEWRERRAADLDVPVRQVLSDIGVVAVAQQAPTTIEKLRQLRGVDGRHLRNGADSEILTAVIAGQKAPATKRMSTRPPELPRELRPVVTLVTSWISQLARDHTLDPALLATRADVEALLRGDEDGRLNSGWRAELVGGPITALVQGEAALAFDGEGQLVLEQRSRKPLLD